MFWTWLDMVRHGLDMFLVWFFRQSEGKLVGLRGRRIRGGVGYGEPLKSQCLSNLMLERFSGVKIGGDNQVDNAFVEK